MLGLVSVKLGVLMPMTIIFVSYEAIEALIELINNHVFFKGDIHETYENWIIVEELRKDLGEYVIGVLLAMLLF